MMPETCQGVAKSAEMLQGHPFSPSRLPGTMETKMRRLPLGYMKACSARACIGPDNQCGMAKLPVSGGFLFAFFSANPDFAETDLLDSTGIPYHDVCFLAS
ncbi:hypothetical protein [Paenibacillus sp. FSL W8-0194]|uniref:hypothetical protein n=1 Tax=Paenibacillus sp. FSL W8-0194 TaxID=2921711 RepID=UPI0030D839D5